MTRCGTTRNHTTPDAARHARTPQQPRPPIVRRGPSAGDSSAMNCCRACGHLQEPNNPFSSCCVQATGGGARCSDQDRAQKASTAQHLSTVPRTQNRLTIPSSAASEASPLQRVVRPTVGEEPSQTVKMRKPSWPKSLSSPRCTDQGVEAWRCPSREPRLAAGRLARRCRSGPFALGTDGPT